nr:aminoglycoside phosphotransferase family protein [Kineococcus siccus]
MGPVPARIDVTADLVQQLVRDQFPEWGDLPVRPVAAGGWDNRTFHLGPDLSVRLPSAAEYALAVDKEQRWLPRLAPQLPLPVPTPLAQGRPGRGYPFAWSVYGWLDGDPVTPDRIADPTEFAFALADFLAALRRVDPTGGPPPGTHNWFRGGTLHTFDDTTASALDALRDVVDVERARAVWGTALAARWDGVPTWFHGDVAAGNLLLRNGDLAAVIDFGTCGVGDPACDLAAAWTLLGDAGREAFRDRLPVGEAEWARGRGWALWKTLATCAGDLEQGGPSAGDRRILEGLLGGS